jgi:hypothetical protein
MAQTGYTPILIYSSSTTTNAPAVGNLTNSTLGSELAINITDGKLFYKDNANAIQVIGWKTTPTTAGGTGLTSYTAGDLLYYATGTTLSKLAIGASGSWLGSSGTAPQWNAPAALTKTDDTNVTLTLGGSASTALLNAASLTLGWTGTLAVSRGGTGTGTAFTAGSVVFAGASGVYSQDNSNLFWDNTNDRLGIKNASPLTDFQIGSSRQFFSQSNLGTNDIYGAGIGFAGYFNTDASPPVLVLPTGRNTTGASAISGSYTGELDFYTYDSGSTAAGSVNLSTARRMRIHPSGGVSIGNTTDPGANNLSVTGKVSVANTFESTAFTAINPSAVTTIATGVSFLAVIRDRGNGDTALVLYENNATPVIVSQTSSKFVTGSPSATEIQIANLSGGGGITALSGATIGVTNINISILKNQ